MNNASWSFPHDTFKVLPSIKEGINTKQELYNRQQCAYHIAISALRLRLTQLVSNTAIVFMHRFYMFQSMNRFPQNEMAIVFVFLASKIEEQYRPLKHIIRAFSIGKNNEQELLAKEATYNIYEKILVQTLGFEFMILHPHIHIVKAVDALKVPREVSQTAYFMASAALHLTYFPVQLKETFVAAICIKLACSWAKYDLKSEINGTPWWHILDDQLNFLFFEEYYQYLDKILEKCSSQLKSILVKFSIYNKDGTLYHNPNINSEKNQKDSENIYDITESLQEKNRKRSVQPKISTNEKKKSIKPFVPLNLIKNTGKSFDFF